MKPQPTLPVRKAAHLMLLLSLLSAAGASAQTATTHEKTAALPFPVVTRFENFGEKDGLPSHKVHCVLKTGDGKLWIGTTNGLCVRETDGRFRRYGPEDGLSHPVVLQHGGGPPHRRLVDRDPAGAESIQRREDNRLHADQQRTAEQCRLRGGGH